MVHRTTTPSTRPDSMRSFSVIWTGQAFSLFGSALVQFALVWWLTEASGSATVLTLATMMAVLPQVFINPIAGTLVDRWNRRTVMMAADALIALAVVVLAVLFALDQVRVGHIYALIFVRAIGSAFHWPAMQASTTLLVPEKHLARVAGLNQALQGFSSIVAPPLGALLLQVLPMQGILAVDVTTAMLAITTLLFVHIPQPERTMPEPGTARSSVLVELRQGMRFVRAWPGLMMIMGMAMLINLLIFPAMSLQPLLVTEHFGGGALQLAWLQSTFGLGMVAGGITLGVWGGFKRRTVTGLLALTLNGVGLAVVGLTPAGGFPLAVAAMLFAWFMNPIANGSLFATLQATVPPEMQGRVFNLLQSGAWAAVPLGLAIAGPLADTLGVRIWYVMAGIGMVVMGVGALKIPTIVHMEDGDSEEIIRIGDGHAVGVTAQ